MKKKSTGLFRTRKQLTTIVRQLYACMHYYQGFRMTKWEREWDKSENSMPDGSDRKHNGPKHNI
jgi:hypothetical protein